MLSLWAGGAGGGGSGGSGGGDGDGSVVSHLERDAGPQGTERTVSHMGKEFFHLRKDSVFLATLMSRITFSVSPRGDQVDDL